MSKPYVTSLIRGQHFVLSPYIKFLLVDKRLVQFHCILPQSQMFYLQENYMVCKFVMLAPASLLHYHTHCTQHAQHPHSTHSSTQQALVFYCLSTSEFSYINQPLLYFRSEEIFPLPSTFHSSFLKQ